MVTPRAEEEDYRGLISGDDWVSPAFHGGRELVVAISPSVVHESEGVG